MTTIVTTVVWTVVCTAGALGLRLRYEPAHIQLKEMPPIGVEKLDVKLVGSTVVAASNQPSPLPPTSFQSPPPLPSFPVVADPMPILPFTAPAKMSPPMTRAVAPIQHLVFGSGEGDKPAPEYPREAKIARQQGTVVVRFSVDATGQVTDVAAAVASPYALLNQAAIRAVRETWRFPDGERRVYDVTFQFELHPK